MTSANLELATAIGLAGNAASLARAIGVRKQTIQYQVKRGYLSPREALRVREIYGLDYEKLTTPHSGSPETNEAA